MSESKGWAVVTGASAGIGNAFALELAGRGHPVLVVARRRDRLEQLVAKIRSGGGTAELLAADLGTSEGVALVANRAAELSDVELLVNNAGFGTYGAFSSLPLEREIGSIRLNVEALVSLTHRLLPLLLRRGSGAVVNVASTLAFQPGPYFTTYAATKAFVLSFSEALSQELKGTGVRVRVVCPGPVTTEFGDVAGSMEMQKKVPNLTPEQVVRAALERGGTNRVVRVVGFLNKLLAFMPRITPRPLMCLIMAAISRPSSLPSLTPPAAASRGT